MLPEYLKGHTFVQRLQDRADPAESRRIERVLATARVVLGAASLAAFYVDPRAARSVSPLVSVVLIAYIAYGISIALALRYLPTRGPYSGFAILAGDILAATLLTLFTDGPNSPFLMFFLFALLLTAYRWGFPETIATAVTTAFILIGQEALIQLEPSAAWHVHTGPEWSRIPAPAASVLIVGFLLGFLAERQKRLSAERFALARIMADIQAEASLARALRKLCAEVLRLYGARLVLVASHDHSSDRQFLWQAVPSESDIAPAEYEELDDARRDVYFFPASAECWSRSSPPGPAPSSELPAAFHAAHRHNSIVAASSGVADEWSARVFILDPNPDALSPAGRRFLRAIVAQAGPVLHSIYLLGRLRARVGANERTRVAREIHDGPIQSLIGLEMNLMAYRTREAERLPAALREYLSKMQATLHEEVVGLRELMQQIKPLEVAPEELLSRIAEVAERFERETGIPTLFDHDGGAIRLSTRACREIVRITQEALVNIRKHSGATSAEVRFLRREGAWILRISDNGKGFAAANTGSPQRARIPGLIHERARSISAELVIESTPGKGSTVEITIPGREHAGG
jgi:signal transduction histidine kinase